MSRSAGLKPLSGGHGNTSQGLQGLAIITENLPLKTKDISFEKQSPIPDISIDESYLTNNNRPTTTQKQSGIAAETLQARGITRLPSDTLCGARIAVYRHTATGRADQRNVSTISGVFRIGDRHFALTAAHVFFDNVSSSGDWADSGLYVTHDSHNGANPGIPPPKISETYEVFIESYWPNAADLDFHTKPTNIPIGLVAPSVLHRRKAPESRTLPEVIWDDELDWALIELSEPALWQINKLQVTPSMSFELQPPPFDQKPPSDKVLVIAGVTGVIKAVGLDSTEMFRFPWSGHEINVWTIEGDIAVGDCGAMVVDPTSGVVYGFVVSHDVHTVKTVVVPAPSIFESILSRYSEDAVTLTDMFSVGHSTTSSVTFADEKLSDEYLRTPVVRSAETNVFDNFKNTLKTFSMQSIKGRRFIRKNALMQWLVTIRRDGISHLDFMLDDAYPRNSILPTTSDRIASGVEASLLVFSILYELRRGDLIDQFMRQGLTDSRLPFDMSLLNNAADRMDISEDDNIPKEFYDAQWAYCPMMFSLEMERDVSPHIIVPVHHRQQVNAKGGTATLWQITVLEEFVGKKLQAASFNARFNDPADKLGYRYRFAIKSFTTDQYAFFESEVNAFKAFRTISSMIGYLGNFHQTVVRPKQRGLSFSISEERKQKSLPSLSETNNILLEYGDFDLDEYFAATHPPVLSIQITQFWQEIAGIAEAVSEIHQFSTRRGGVKQEFSGWHADIKPDNILSVKGVFKLADPGFARFEKSEKKMTRLAGGTKTYGSPETFSTQRMQDKPVSQAIDIWSLGCVLSVAATWMILGWPGVTQFQQLRVEALKRQVQMPTRIRSKKRTKSFGRTASVGFEGGREQIFPEGDCFHNGTRLLDEITQWHKFLRSVSRKSDSVSIQMLDLIDEKMLLTRPEDRIEAAELYRQMRLIVHGSEIANYDSVPDFVGRILLKREKKEAEETPVFNAMVRASARRELITTSSPKFGSPQRSMRTPSPQPAVASKVTLDTASTLSIDDHSQAITEDKEKEKEKPQPAFHKLILNEAGGRSVPDSIDIPVETKPSYLAQPALKTARRMSVTQARAEVDKKRRVFSRRKKDPFLTKHLENRDIEFLVDNGDTMAAHWNEVKDLVEILCSMVSDVDKDGFDLGFTTGPVRLTQKSNAKAVKSTMSHEHARPVPGVRTDMSEALYRTLRAYFHKIKAKKFVSKAYTLIVLTDGVWRGMEEYHAVEDTVIRFLNELIRHKGPLRDEREVTIQFIQFGNDEEATGRLLGLDRGLRDFEVPDIIDTEPSNGNVWKMLLGSVEASFDYADSGT